MPENEKTEAATIVITGTTNLFEIAIFHPQ
jgi:hypothetical protein